MCSLQSPIRSLGRLPVGLGSSNKIPCHTTHRPLTKNATQPCFQDADLGAELDVFLEGETENDLSVRKSGEAKVAMRR